MADLLADGTDLLPTFAALGGQDQLPHPIDGASFAKLLIEGKEIAVRTRDWKLLHDGQLFDMRGDPFAEVAIPKADDTPESKAARTRLSEILARLKQRASNTSN